MVFSESQFTKAADDVKTVYRKAKLDQTWDGKDAFSEAGVEVAWKVYRAVLRASKNTNFIGLIIGGLRNDEQPPDEQGSGIDPKVKENFWTMHEATKKHGAGGVLKSRNWSILVNDAFVLGAVHTGMKFFLASERSPANVYVNGQFKVFGRELVALKCFEYTDVPHDWPDLGEVWAPINDTAKTPTFKHYQKHVAYYQVGTRWHALVSRL